MITTTKISTEDGLEKDEKRKSAQFRIILAVIYA